MARLSLPLFLERTALTSNLNEAEFHFITFSKTGVIILGPNEYYSENRGCPKKLMYLKGPTRPKERS
jgi:hypothetical protein